MDLLALVTPRRCLACAEPGPDLCRPCRDALPLIGQARCRRCGTPAGLPVEDCATCRGRRLAFASARAAAIHAGPAAALMTAWKDRGLRRAGTLLAELVLATVPGLAGARLVPVPAVGDRVRWRGADPPAELAARLGAAWGCEVDTPLVRVRALPQRGLDVAERGRNARAAFEQRGRVAGHVVLVDDVYTTGATAQACALLLRRGGAARVDVITAVRAVRRP